MCIEGVNIGRTRKKRRGKDLRSTVSSDIRLLPVTPSFCVSVSRTPAEERGEFASNASKENENVPVSASCSACLRRFDAETAVLDPSEAPTPDSRRDGDPVSPCTESSSLLSASFPFPFQPANAASSSWPTSSLELVLTALVLALLHRKQLCLTLPHTHLDPIPIIPLGRARLVLVGRCVATRSTASPSAARQLRTSKAWGCGRGGGGGGAANAARGKEEEEAEEEAEEEGRGENECGGGAERTQLVAAAVGVRVGGRAREKKPKVGQRKSRTGEGAVAVVAGAVLVLAFAMRVREGGREGRVWRQSQAIWAVEEDEVGRLCRTASADAAGDRGISSGAAGKDW